MVPKPGTLIGPPWPYHTHQAAGLGLPAPESQLPLPERNGLGQPRGPGAGVVLGSGGNQQRGLGRVVR